MTEEKTTGEKAEELYNGLKEILDNVGTVIVSTPLNFNEYRGYRYTGDMKYNPRDKSEYITSPFQFSGDFYMLPQEDVNYLDLESLNRWTSQWLGAIEKHYKRQKGMNPSFSPCRDRHFSYDERERILKEWPIPLVELKTKISEVEEEYILKFEKSLGGTRSQVRNLGIFTDFSVTAFPHEYATRNFRQLGSNMIGIPDWVWQYPTNKRPLFDYIKDWLERGVKVRKAKKQLSLSLEELATTSCQANAFDTNLGVNFAFQVLDHAKVVGGDRYLRRLAVFISNRVGEIDPDKDIVKKINRRIKKDPFFLELPGF